MVRAGELRGNLGYSGTVFGGLGFGAVPGGSLLRARFAPHKTPRRPYTVVLKWRADLKGDEEASVENWSGFKCCSATLVSRPRNRRFGMEQDLVRAPSDRTIIVRSD
jgi:hypothetical protein